VGAKIGDEGINSFDLRGAGQDGSKPKKRLGPLAEAFQPVEPGLHSVDRPKAAGRRGDRRRAPQGARKMTVACTQSPARSRARVQLWRCVWDREPQEVPRILFVEHLGDGRVILMRFWCQERKPRGPCSAERGHTLRAPAGSAACAGGSPCGWHDLQKCGGLAHARCVVGVQHVHRNTPDFCFVYPKICLVEDCCEPQHSPSSAPAMSGRSTVAFSDS